MIAAVVLAAGGSERLGHPKQLVLLGGRSLVRRAVDACTDAGCSPVVVVVGAAEPVVRQQLVGSAARPIPNPGWREGLASSIRTGIAAVGDDVQAAVLVACDQPGLEASTIRRLIDAFDGAPDRMVACEYGGTIGIPALFGPARFDELRRLSGDRGAKQLLLAHRRQTVLVSWPPGAADVDRPEDLPDGGGTNP